MTADLGEILGKLLPFIGAAWTVIQSLLNMRKAAAQAQVEATQADTEVKQAVSQSLDYFIGRVKELEGAVETFQQALNAALEELKEVKSSHVARSAYEALERQVNELRDQITAIRGEKDQEAAEKQKLLEKLTEAEAKLIEAETKIVQLEKDKRLLQETLALRAG